MIYTLIREQDDGTATWGRLYKSLTPIYYTMEPSLSHTSHPCLPVGCYELRWSYSPKYKRKMLEVLENLPNRSGIRIHSLNYAHESLGCIGLGNGRAEAGHKITDSRRAVKAFETAVVALLEARERVFLDIKRQ